MNETACDHNLEAQVLLYSSVVLLLMFSILHKFSFLLQAVIERSELHQMGHKPIIIQNPTNGPLVNK